MHQAKTIILGGGMCGLGAALSSNLAIYEATNRPGGVCYSYYVEPDGTLRDPRDEDVSECFRFEPAGGHWLFGVSPDSLERLEKFATFNKYMRQAAVYFPQSGQLVPYPLQDNLRYLDRTLRERVLAEICFSEHGSFGESPSLKEWLLNTFGPALCELFFFPFNDRYTAGLFADVAPQDLFKSSLDRERVLRGAIEGTEDTGYNRFFYYPRNGLDHLIRSISAECKLHFKHRVSHIDTGAREVHFANGACISYERIISTIPLNSMVQLCEIECSQPPDPATAVLVVNIGAVKGRDCSPYHWIYLPSSQSGMHRIGYYSHVEPSFLPVRYRSRSDVVSIYAERSFLASAPPSQEEQSLASSAIVKELRDWGLISDLIVVHWTFTNPAYTWSRRGSTWAQEASHRLAQVGILQIGRYGGWHFQGMLESFEQGLSAGRSQTMEITKQM